MEALENITYDELNVGDSASYTKTLTEAELILFAAVSGDVNPVVTGQARVTAPSVKLTLDRPQLPRITIGD